jgi:tetratricopeptide (TPR) repeat protein
LSFLLSFQAVSETIPELEAKLKQTPDRLPVRNALAAQYFKGGQFDKVIPVLNPYTDQLDETAFLTLANSYSNLKDHLNEVRILNVLIGRDEDDYRWRMLAAQAYLKLANTLPKGEKAMANAMTSAILQLRQVVTLQPKFKPGFDLLLITFLNQRQNNEARQLLTDGLNRYGERAELFRELCRLDSLDGFLVEAIQNCRKAIKLAPNYPDNYVYLVQTMHDQGEFEQAERNIISAARKFPKEEFVQWSAGTIFFKKKNFPVASRYFQTAVNADPNSLRAHSGLAQALFENGEDEAALAHFVKTCATDRASYEAFLIAGAKVKQKGNNTLGQKYRQAAYACRN